MLENAVLQQIGEHSDSWHGAGSKPNPIALIMQTPMRDILLVIAKKNNQIGVVTAWNSKTDSVQMIKFVCALNLHGHFFQICEFFVPVFSNVRKHGALTQVHVRHGASP